MAISVTSARSEVVQTPAVAKAAEAKTKAPPSAGSTIGPSAVVSLGRAQPQTFSTYGSNGSLSKTGEVAAKPAPVAKEPAPTAKKPAPAPAPKTPEPVVAKKPEPKPAPKTPEPLVAKKPEPQPTAKSPSPLRAA